MIRADIEDDLRMDAMRIEGIEALNPHMFFSNILPRPWSSKGRDLYVIAMNKPVVPEVERGILGTDHLERLFSFLKTSYAEGHLYEHIRTDGYEVWSVLSGMRTLTSASVPDPAMDTQERRAGGDCDS